MKSILNVFRHGLQKTKTGLMRRLQGVFSDTAQWDESCYDELEAALISTDLGVDVSMRLVDDIRERYERGLVHTTEDIMAVARENVVSILKDSDSKPMVMNADGPTVVLLVGVNGSGKTTTAAKLAYKYKSDGHAVMLAAGDTYRAAGTEQLQIWADRVGCHIVAGSQGGDAAAVAYDAVTAAAQREVGMLFIDTAGRQHTRRELMAELEKMKRSVGKAMDGAPHEVWLTVDASTGTNALIQAREFGKLFDITGLVLTKLDGTGKGGVVVAIGKELGYPVRFIGLGERMDDLQPFDPEVFATALFQ